MQVETEEGRREGRRDCLSFMKRWCWWVAFHTLMLQTEFTYHTYIVCSRASSMSCPFSIAHLSLRRKVPVCLNFNPSEVRALPLGIAGRT